jgi:hypothetical protein
VTPKLILDLGIAAGSGIRRCGKGLLNPYSAFLSFLHRLFNSAPLSQQGHPAYPPTVSRYHLFLEAARAMAEEKKDTIVLITSDDEQYTVEKKVAERSQMIKSMMEGEWRTCGCLCCWAVCVLSRDLSASTSVLVAKAGTRQRACCRMTGYR